MIRLPFRPAPHTLEKLHARAVGIAISLTLFTLMAAGVHKVIWGEHQRIDQEHRTQIAQQASAILSRLESELVSEVFLAKGLSAHVVAMGGRLDQRADQALATLFRYGRHIRNVGIAPGNRITRVFPREGNEAALGLYYPDHPQQWPAVKRAIAERKTIVAGPVPLAQGGNGVISRTPVFFEDGSYWGILSLVMDADLLFRDVGLTDTDGTILYALRGRDGRGAEGDIFLGDAALFQADSILLDVNIPGGTWQLAARPAAGWYPDREHLYWMEIAALAASALLALGVLGYHRAQNRVFKSEKRIRTFLDTTRDGVIVIDDKGIIQEFNPAATILFGYGEGEVVGKSLNRLMPAADARTHDHHVANPHDHKTRMMAKGREVLGRRKDGSEFPIEVTVGEAIHQGRRFYVGVVRDITERKAFEKRLLDLATTDELTGAMNRRAFLEAAENALQLARRHDQPLSLLMIDADHFKKINDTFGHQTGDRVLKRLADVARESLRTTDHFGRLGGEEFVALLPHTDVPQALEVAQRLITAVRNSAIAVEGSDTPLTFAVSIGAACLDDDCPDLAALLHRADEKLYEAKQSGRDRVCYEN